MAEERSAQPGQYEDLYRLFALAWALAALFHYEFVALVYQELAWAPKVTGAIVASAALATLLRPADSRRLASLAFAQLVDVVVLLPQVANHWLLAGFVNLTWLLAIAHAWRRGGRFPPQGGPLLEAVRTPLLVGVALFYLWAGFWKLNQDYLRPEVSCAVAFWQNLLEQFRWLPDGAGLRRAVIWTTLLAELVAPVLLLVRRTRCSAALALIGFHTLLGLDAIRRFANFSSMMFALLLLYVPPAAPARLRGALPVLAGRAWLAGRVAAASYAALVAASLLAGPRAPLYLDGRWVVWLAYAGLLLAVVALAAAITPAERRTPASLRVAWIFPALVFVNGLSPILGIKNRTSWQMYSNLRLEAEASNHFLVPRSLDLLGALADRVVVRDASVRALALYAGSGLDLTWIEFRRLAAAHPEASVTYERGGVSERVERVGDAPALAPPPILLRKLTFFRPLGPRVAEACVW